MRRGLLLAAGLAAALGSAQCASRHAPSPAPEPIPQAAPEPPPQAAPEPAPQAKPLAPSPQQTAPVDFESTVRPILEARCRPCHFPDGKMYDRLPFDRPGTIRDLGTRLFTRIDDPGEQSVIRAFLGLPPE